MSRNELFEAKSVKEFLLISSVERTKINFSVRIVSEVCKEDVRMSTLSERGSSFPLGRNDQALAAVGTVGIDGYGIPKEPLPRALQGKFRIGFDQIEGKKAELGVTIPESHEFPAGTGMGFGLAIAKAQHPDKPAVQFVAPLPINDPHVKRIEATILQENMSIKGTAYEGRVSYSIVVKNEEGDKALFTAKEETHPPLELPSAEEINAIVVGPLGDPVETYHTIADLTGDKIARIVVGSSLINNQRLTNNPQLREAYFRVLTGAGGLFVNDEEASTLISVATDEKPSEEPITLARQLQRAFAIPFVSMSRGPQGAIALAGEDIHNLVTKPLLPEEIENVTGCGDGFGGYLAAAIREGGMEPESVKAGLEGAAASARNIAKTLDSLSGQMRYKEPVNGHKKSLEHTLVTFKELAYPKTIIDLGHK